MGQPIFIFGTCQPLRQDQEAERNLPASLRTQGKRCRKRGSGKDPGENIKARTPIEQNWFCHDGERALYYFFDLVSCIVS